MGQELTYSSVSFQDYSIVRWSTKIIQGSVGTQRNYLTQQGNNLAVGRYKCRILTSFWDQRHHHAYSLVPNLFRICYRFRERLVVWATTMFTEFSMIDSRTGADSNLGDLNLSRVLARTFTGRPPSTSYT